MSTQSVQWSWYSGCGASHSQSVHSQYIVSTAVVAVVVQVAVSQYSDCGAWTAALATHLCARGSGRVTRVADITVTGAAEGLV